MIAFTGGFVTVSYVGRKIVKAFLAGAITFTVWSVFWYGPMYTLDWLIPHAIAFAQGFFASRLSYDEFPKL